MTKPTKWHVRPAETQISLGTHCAHTHFVGFVMLRLIYFDCARYVKEGGICLNPGAESL